MSKESFDKVDFWLKDVTEKIGNQALYLLIGNKKDLVDERVVKEEDGVRKMQELGLDLFFESSAKTGESVGELFESIIEAIVNKNLKEPKKI